MGDDVVVYCHITQTLFAHVRCPNLAGEENEALTFSSSSQKWLANSFSVDSLPVDSLPVDSPFLLHEVVVALVPIQVTVHHSSQLLGAIYGLMDPLALTSALSVIISLTLATIDFRKSNFQEIQRSCDVMMGSLDWITHHAETNNTSMVYLV